MLMRPWHFLLQSRSFLLRRHPDPALLEGEGSLYLPLPLLVPLPFFPSFPLGICFFVCLFSYRRRRSPIPDPPDASPSTDD